MKLQNQQNNSFIKRVWNRFTDRFQTTIIHPQYFTFLAVEKGVVAAERYAKGTLIDLGCGRMPYRNRLISKVKKYIAVDNPETAIFYHGEFKPDVYAKADSVPLKSGVADVVILLQVLEYIDDPQKTLREIARLLKRDGTLIISVPFFYPIHDIPYDKIRYTESGLRLLMENAGFSIISLTSEGTFLDFLGQAINVFIMKRIQDLLRQRKNLAKLTYLSIFIVFGIPIIITINVLVYGADKLFLFLPKMPNYFPLDYILIVKKKK